MPYSRPSSALNEHSLIVEPARRDDVAAVVALLADDFLGRLRDRCDHDGLIQYQKAFDAIDLDPNNTLFVARLDDTIAGCFQFTLIPGLSFGGRPRAQIESVRTRNDLRGRGIGAAMMEFAIARARSEGCCLVQLSTNKQRVDAHRFYKRLGFEATHQGMKLMLG